MPALPRRGAPTTLGPNYRKLWTAAAASTVGDGVHYAALALLAASLTRDPLKVSAVVFASELPVLLFILPAVPWSTAGTGAPCCGRSTLSAASSSPSWPLPCSPAGPAFPSSPLPAFSWVPGSRCSTPPPRRSSRRSSRATRNGWSGPTAASKA